MLSPCAASLRRLLSTSKRPTTPLGMLAWDAREEAARRVAEDGRAPDALEAHESVMERVANRKIREAMSSGEFDFSSSHGKPLPRDDAANSAAANISPAQAMLNKVLANNNITPAFITEGRAIRKDVAAFKEELAITSGNNMGSREQLSRRLVTINKRIRSFNKINRIPSMHMAPLSKAYLDELS